MNLYVMRHAHAVAASEWNGADSARPLTDKGRAAAIAVAAGLAREAAPDSQIVSSPYARALETADIVGKRLGAPVASNEALTPGFDVSRLVSTLSKAGWPDTCMLVGHEPDLGRLLSALVGREQQAFTLKKASVALVTLPAARLPAPGWHALSETISEATLVWLRTWREWEAQSDE